MCFLGIADTTQLTFLFFVSEEVHGATTTLFESVSRHGGDCLGIHEPGHCTLEGQGPKQQSVLLAWLLIVFCHSFELCSRSIVHLHMPMECFEVYCHTDIVGTVPPRVLPGAQNSHGRGISSEQ
jgi:hypothetical protein